MTVHVVVRPSAILRYKYPCVLHYNIVAECCWWARSRSFVALRRHSQLKSFHRFPGCFFSSDRITVLPYNNNNNSSILPHWQVSYTVTVWTRGATVYSTKIRHVFVAVAAAAAAESVDDRSVWRVLHCVSSYRRLRQHSARHPRSTRHQSPLRLHQSSPCADTESCVHVYRPSALRNAVRISPVSVSPVRRFKKFIFFAAGSTTVRFFFHRSQTTTHFLIFSSQRQAVRSTPKCFDSRTMTIL